jgi:hypothetical protein
MPGFVDYLRMAMGWWSGLESSEPDPQEGITLRLRCDNSLTLTLSCTNSKTFRLPTTNTLTLRLRER